MRKVFLLTLVALLGVVKMPGRVFALGPEESWSEIRGTLDVIPQAPMIFFGAHGISVLDVCLSGDTFRATTSEGTPAVKPLGSTPRSYDIKVVRVVGDGEHTSFRYLFTKHFDVPTCG